MFLIPPMFSECRSSDCDKKFVYSRWSSPCYITLMTQIQQKILQKKKYKIQMSVARCKTTFKLI